MKHIEEIELDKIASDAHFKEETRRYIEQKGIVFIEEIDKLCARGYDEGRRSRTWDDRAATTSLELTQRMLIPLLEGCDVQTDVGVINTRHILFVTSGTFHGCQPSDLIPELQVPQLMQCFYILRGGGMYVLLKS